MTPQRRNKFKRKKLSEQLVRSHLAGIKRELLEGEKRPAFLEFLAKTDARRGLYALYDKRGKLYYAGKAIDLKRRIDQHLKDRHAESWDQMTLFFLSESANVSELEGLLIATVKPPGNKVKPKIGTDIRRSLEKFLKEDAVAQIRQVIYPDMLVKEDKLSGRLTPKKLKSLERKKLAKALDVSYGRVSQLWNEDKKSLKVLLRYIKSTGKRDAVLLAFEKNKIA
jgi:hypothetical protein